MKTAAGKITNLQKELLKLFHYEMNGAELLEIKDILVSYFSNKASDGMDKLWTEKKWTNKTMDKIAKQHLRTPYK